VLFVKLPLFVFGDAEVGADFFSDHLLGDDLVAHVLFEVFVRNALGGGGLFQLFHRVQLHVLAHLVQALDQVGIAGDAEVFALFQQELLVDKIAQDVFFPVGVEFVGIGRILLFHVVLELVLGTEEL
jgi:hypothetical protein